MSNRKTMALALKCVAIIGYCALVPAQEPDASADSLSAETSLEQMRLTMDKWIETQQIISKERKDWQQGKDILVGRLELIQNEVARLKEKIEEAKSGATESNDKHKELTTELEEIRATGTKLSESAATMEAEIKRMFVQLPEPIQVKLQPLYERIPENPVTARVSTAERFQNVLGILNELNKANNEISVSYEVHTLADGKPSEVKAIYVGLAQAYYVSAKGETGIGQPSPEGWKWKPMESHTREILLTLDVLQGKHTPIFIPMPVTIQ